MPPPPRYLPRYQITRERPGLWVAWRDSPPVIAMRRPTHAALIRDLCQLLKVRARLNAEADAAWRWRRHDAS